MTATILTAVGLLIIGVVAVVAVRLLQELVTRSLELVASEAAAARVERDTLLDRLQAPFAAAQRLTPESSTTAVKTDTDIDAEWAAEPSSEVFVPEDLSIFDEEESLV